MTKKLFFIAAMFFIVTANAQDTKKVFGSPTIVWYGIDFTKLHIVGMDDESPNKVITEYFREWNMITVDMDLAKVFQKNTAAKDPNGIQKLNLTRAPETLKGKDDADISDDVVATSIKEMPVGQKKEGLGVVFIAQSFNKTSNAALVHVVFFDIASRAVLWHKKMTGKPSGGATVKAWTAALKDIFEQIQKKEFSAWKKEANF